CEKNAAPSPCSSPAKIFLTKSASTAITISFPEYSVRLGGATSRFNRHGTRYRGATRHKSVGKRKARSCCRRSRAQLLKPAGISRGAEGSDYAAFASLQLAQGISCGAMLI